MKGDRVAFLMAASFPCLLEGLLLSVLGLHFFCDWIVSVVTVCALETLAMDIVPGPIDLSEFVRTPTRWHSSIVPVLFAHAVTSHCWEMMGLNTNATIVRIPRRIDGIFHIFSCS